MSIKKALSFIEDSINQSALSTFEYETNIKPSIDFIIGQYHACILCKELLLLNNIGEHITILKNKFELLQVNNINTNSAYFDGFINIINIIENIIEEK